MVAPPSEALAYRLFPEAHVRSRQSQLEALPTTAAPLREAHLRPGDVLYLPPLWLHRVTAGAELSVSVNRFQDSRENAGARARPRRRLPPALRKPRKDDLPFPGRVALLALWLRFLLHRACGGAPSATAADAADAAAATVLRPHLESRFGLLHERIGCASWAPRSARRAPSCRRHSSTRRARTRRRRPRRSTSGSRPAAAAPAARTTAAPPMPPRPTTRRGASCSHSNTPS